MSSLVVIAQVLTGSCLTLVVAKYCTVVVNCMYAAGEPCYYSSAVVGQRRSPTAW